MNNTEDVVLHVVCLVYFEKVLVRESVTQYIGASLQPLENRSNNTGSNNTANIRYSYNQANLSFFFASSRSKISSFSVPKYLNSAGYFNEVVMLQE